MTTTTIIDTLRLKVHTDQEAFDAVVRHLGTLAKPAKKDEFNCVYVAPNGDRCAIGALIKADDDTVRLWENHWYVGSVEDAVDGDHLDVGNINLDLLNDLQNTHDSEGNWGPEGFVNWDHLRDIGKDHRLSTAVVDRVLSNA